MYVLWLACQHRIPATVSVTADTGWEDDCLVSTGERMNAHAFWERYVKPLAEAHGIAAHFVRARDRSGAVMPSLIDYHLAMVKDGMPRKFKPLMPMYGSRGGRAQQKCTSRFKIAAIRQDARRMGAKTTRSAHALHMGEMQRMKGANLRLEGGWHTWNAIDGTRKIKRNGIVVEVPRVVKWVSHYYPLIDLRMTRQMVDDELDCLGIPYIVGSQCDGCPHKNLSRWDRTSESTIIRLAEIERRTPGWYFTSMRVPLPVAIERMRAQPSLFADSDFGCGNAVCGV